MENLEIQHITARLKLQMLVFNAGGELLFSSWSSFLGPGDAPESLDGLKSMLNHSATAVADFTAFLEDTTRSEFECDFAYQCKSQGNGAESSYFRLSAARIQQNNENVLAVHVADVSREYSLIHEMESLERQASAGQMAAGVAHEFNNILTAMMGWTQLASKAVNGNDSAQIAISTIDNNTRRARRIAGELLEISSPSKTVERQLLYVGDVLKDALKLLTWDLANQQINVVEEIYETLPSSINATRLVQVFVNIIRNAMDAMGKNGTISVRVAQQGESVVTTISDTGEGISDEALDRVFQPFFTTKRRDDKTFGGSGLGMVVSKRIVEEFGGTIALSRGETRDIGTVVTVTLPSQPEPRESACEDHNRPSTFPPGASVLVVDDEPDICEMIRMALSLRGAHVVSATNGEEALKLCATEEFNAAFLDFSMSGLSGYDLRDAISAAQPDLPIVFMSGVDIPNLAKEADFLKKPFDLHDIQVKLREILER